MRQVLLLLQELCVSVGAGDTIEEFASIIYARSYSIIWLLVREVFLFPSYRHGNEGSEV